MNRTFNGLNYDAEKRKIPTLRNILTAYARRNPTVGYCQGLNFIVAQLMRYLGEEEVFWTLCMIIEVLLPLDYYTCMLGILVDQGVFKKLISKTLPDLWKMFKTNKLDPNIFTVQWFVCMFAENIEPELLDEIWDNLFIHGSKIIFKTGVAFLQLIEKNLLLCSDLGNFPLY